MPLCFLQWFHHAVSFNIELLCLFSQAVDIRQIYDKFPEKKGGLKELYDKGPTPAFFLVKFWVSVCLYPVLFLYQKADEHEQVGTFIKWIQIFIKMTANGQKLLILHNFIPQADLNTNVQDETGAFYAVTSR